MNNSINRINTVVTSGKRKTRKRSSSKAANPSELEAVLKVMFAHYIVMKMYHFQTKGYGAHKTVDSYLDDFLGNMDKYLEVAQGYYNRTVKPPMDKLEMDVSLVNDTSVMDYIRNFISELSNLIPENVSELCNIRDEMVADADQLLYLLKFK